MTPHELKQEVERRNTESYFFSRNNMRFSGDTMRNYGVRSATITTVCDEENVECWELYRKRPVKQGLQASAYFRKDTMEQTYIKRK